MNSLQQFLPHLFAMLRLCEFIHNRPFMNPEAVRQLQAAAARQHGADLPHHLALPFREIVLRFLRLFCQTPYFLCRSDDLARVWIQVGKAILALHLQCLDDLSKRNDICHTVPRCCRSNPHGRKAIIATIARHSKRSPKRFFRDSLPLESNGRTPGAGVWARSKTRPTESSPHDNATDTPVGYLPTWTTRPGFIDCNATRASGACGNKSFRAIDLVRKITTAILRPARFCSYRKPRSTVTRTSKPAASAASRSSPFLSPPKPARTEPIGIRAQAGDCAFFD
jgi:hypothetical protein